MKHMLYWSSQAVQLFHCMSVIEATINFLHVEESLQNLNCISCKPIDLGIQFDSALQVSDGHNNLAS